MNKYYYNIAYFWNYIKSDNKINEFKQYISDLFPYQFANKTYKIMCLNNFELKIVEFYLKLDDMDIIYHFSIDQNSHVELVS